MQRYLIFINCDDVVVWSQRSRLLQEDEFVKFLMEGQPTAPQYFPYNVQLNIVSEIPHQYRHIHTRIHLHS